MSNPVRWYRGGLLSILTSLPNFMALSEQGNLYRLFHRFPFEGKETSRRDLLKVEVLVALAQLRARARDILARPLPRRQKYSTGQ